MEGDGGDGSRGFCVNVGVTCVRFTLLMPTLVDVLYHKNSVIMMMELHLLCPLMSILPPVANLALERTSGFVTHIINIGVKQCLKQSTWGRHGSCL